MTKSMKNPKPWKSDTYSALTVGYDFDNDHRQHLKWVHSDSAVAD